MKCFLQLNIKLPKVICYRTNKNRVLSSQHYLQKKLRHDQRKYSAKYILRDEDGNNNDERINYWLPNGNLRIVLRFQQGMDKKHKILLEESYKRSCI